MTSYNYEYYYLFTITNSISGCVRKIESHDTKVKVINISKEEGNGDLFLP